MTPTTLEIIKQYLIDHDYDGLCNNDLECGCAMSDLQPCGDDFSQCKPGYQYMDTNGDLCLVEELPEGVYRIKVMNFMN